MEKNDISIIAGVLLIGLIGAIIGGAYMISDANGIIDNKIEAIDNLKDIKVEQKNYITELEEDKDNLEDDVEYWKELYENYECPEVPPEYIYINTTIFLGNRIYDINRDGVIDYLDSAEVLWYIKHGLTYVETLIFNHYGNPYQKLYDVNIDGRVNMEDVHDIWINCDIV